jgi:hypothetical protein
MLCFVMFPWTDWSVCGSVKLISTDAYIQHHNNLQKAEKLNTRASGAQASLVLAGAALLLRPRMAGLHDLEPPPPPPTGVRNALNEDQVLQMTAGNASFI